jgi:hypothetical protein
MNMGRKMSWIEKLVCAVAIFLTSDRHLRLLSHVPGFDRTGVDRTGEITTWKFNNNISGSNRLIEQPRTP